MNWSNFYPQLFGFLISFENFFILLIILGYGNDKLCDCALSISHLRRHPYVLLPIIIRRRRKKKGKLSTRNNSSAMPASNNCTIPVLSNDDHYKFLGKYQNTRHLEDKVIEEAVKEYENRLWAVWTSPLAVPRKVCATNIYTLPILQYYMWSTDWYMNNLKEIDRLTRHVINECSGKHKYESTRLLYLPSEEGGKGLIEIESLCKKTKLKVAHYINNSDNPHIKLVKSFQKKKGKKKLAVSIQRCGKIFRRKRTQLPL